MNTESIADHLESAPEAADFDVLGYLEEDVTIAKDEVTIHVELQKARELSQLVEDRHELIAQRQRDRQANKAETLSISESDEDTEYDDRINELVEALGKTSLTFKLRSVAPALRKAIDKKYIATEDKTWSEEQKAEHNNDRISDIFARGIVSVVRGDGAEDDRPWDKDRLQALEQKLHESEFRRLMAAINDMIYVGEVFEQALSADFS